MIPDKVTNIFAFIDFLESNKVTYVEKYAPVSKRLIQLGDEGSALSPPKNYKEKQRYDIIQREIEEGFSLIERNVVNPVMESLLNFQIWEGDRFFTSVYNNNIGAISELTRSFTEADIEEVKKYKKKYLSFRTETNSNFLSLAFLFDNLDEVLFVLFDFFKDTDDNEFEPFETKRVRVNSMREVAELLQKNYTKFTMPNGFIKDFEKPEDFEPLKKYIRDNYLDVHPKNFTLERLEQIKRNIRTWKLQLKDLNKAQELQEFINETISDIDLKIERFGNNRKETGIEFTCIEKRVNDFAEILGQHGFFSLQKVKKLSKDGQGKLIYIIATNQLPYCIAMFHFLGFLEQLGNRHFKTKTDLQIEVSKWFDADRQGRTVAANIRVLSPVSNEDRSRYTAHLHKETVKNDYEKLK